MEKKLVSLRACEDYNQENVDACMEKVFEDIGGLEQFIKPGMTVVLKVNLLTRATPTQAITTHHSVVEAVAKKVVGLGARCIIADSPASKFTASHLKSIYEASGMNLAATNSKA